MMCEVTYARILLPGRGSQYYAAAAVMTKPKDSVTMAYLRKSVASAAATSILTTSFSLLFFGFGSSVATAADEPEMPSEIIAAQIRRQGFTCEDPTKAKADPELSKPDEAVWLLQCKSERYRVRLIPDMDAKVERLE